MYGTERCPMYRGAVYRPTTLVDTTRHGRTAKKEILVFLSWAVFSRAALSCVDCLVM